MNPSFPKAIARWSFVGTFVLAAAAQAQQAPSSASPLFEFDNNTLSSRWSSPENLNGTTGAGGKTNNGAKGHAFDIIEAGETRSLLDIQGTGIVNRIWLTIRDRSPETLRSLKIEMYWDNAKKPAVSVPLGDFFGFGLGKTSSFHNALFASPEGRSFVSLIPMPFKTGAKIVVVNESGKKMTNIFFDVDFQYLKSWNPDNMYFHAYWHRDTATTLGTDFELLPNVNGKGRFLGVNFGVNENPIYRDSWWGEGEVKMYLDGDNALPTIAGTGTEDYIGTGWGQGKYVNTYSGCLIADGQQRQWGCYRYHIPDPVFFRTHCRVTLQQIGGNDVTKVSAMQDDKVPLIPVTLDNSDKFYSFFQKDSVVQLSKMSLPDNGWLNFYRSDDLSATAYFYLATPTSTLPVLQPVSVRTYNLKSK